MIHLEVEHSGFWHSRLTFLSNHFYTIPVWSIMALCMSSLNIDAVTSLLMPVECFLSKKESLCNFGKWCLNTSPKPPHMTVRFIFFPLSCSCTQFINYDLDHKEISFNEYIIFCHTVTYFLGGPLYTLSIFHGSG